MKLFTLLKNFKNDESGAVTVDWVVLTAALVGLGIAVITVVSGGINTAATTINTELGTAGNVAGDIVVGGGAGGGGEGGEGGE